MPLNIRPATPADVPQILAFIRELALYEREPDSVIITEATLLRDGFGPAPRFRSILAEEDAIPCGYALFFNDYDSWCGHGFHIEDLFVRPEHRGKGIGKALFIELACLCLAEGGQRLKWEVLEWNTTAIGFYQGIGASIAAQWRNMHVDGDALITLADTPTRS